MLSQIGCWNEPLTGMVAAATLAGRLLVSLPKLLCRLKVIFGEVLGCGMNGLLYPGTQVELGTLKTSLYAGLGDRFLSILPRAAIPGTGGVCLFS